MSQNHVEHFTKMPDTAQQQSYFFSWHRWIFQFLVFFFLFPDKNSDSQNAFEDLAHYEFLAHLRKASTSASLLDHLNHNGKAAVYHPSSGHDELPPAIWSPGAQHRSPDGAGTLTREPTAMLWN